jgi:hypothetical protein
VAVGLTGAVAVLLACLDERRPALAETLIGMGVPGYFRKREKEERYTWPHRPGVSPSAGPGSPTSAQAALSASLSHLAAVLWGLTQSRALEGRIVPFHWPLRVCSNSERGKIRKTAGARKKVSETSRSRSRCCIAPRACRNRLNWT